MKANLKAFLPVLLGAALAAGLLAPFLSAGSLTGPETQTITDCRNNITLPAGELSPAKAAQCLEKFNADGGALMEKFKTDFPVQAVEVVARNNALVDLQSMIGKYDGINLAKSLSRVIENRDCVPCKMELGPAPEKLSGWVKTYFSPDLYGWYNWSVRSWSAIGKMRAAAMAGPGYEFTPESWGALPLQTRYEKLHDWAKKETDSLVAAALAGKAKSGPEEYAKYKASAENLKLDLQPLNDRVSIKKLDDMLRELSSKGAAPVKPSSAEQKTEEMTEAARNLAASMAAGGGKGYLDHGFDNAAVTGGEAGAAASSPGKTFAGVPMTAEQAEQLASRLAVVKGGKLQGYLADELKGTKAGDEIIAFYEGPQYAAKGANKLDLGFTKGTGELKGAIGWWSNSEKVLKINTDVVDAFTKERGITPAELLKDPRLIKDLATYVAPVFVHEAAHQRQSAWIAANGLDYYKGKDGKSWAPYQMEMETEAFSMDASFVAERSKKGGAAYLGKISWWDRADAERYLEEGVEGIRTEKHTYDYYAKHADSIPGAASKELEAAAHSAQRVSELENKEKTSPGEMTAADRAELYRCRTDLDTRFSWYRQVLKKSKDDELKLLDWRDQMDPDGDVLSAIKAYSVVAPGGGK